MVTPLRAEWHNVLRHGVLAEAVIAKGYQVGFFWNEVCYTIFINKANGNNVVALTQHTFRNIVATGRILIVRATNLLTV